MSNTKRSESTSLLSRLDRHLVACAAAATAVGVISDDASAAINYSGVLNYAVNPATAAGVYVNVATFGLATSAAADPGWNLNLFNLSYSSGVYTAVSFYPNGAHAAPTDALVGTGLQGRVAKLAANTNIGPGSTIMALFSNGIGSFNLWDTYGGIAFPAAGFQWLDDGTTNFIGFRANIGGNTHFGWVRVRMDPWQAGIGAPVGNPPVATGAVPITLIDMAWESTPNASILAGQVPEPATAAALGLLALGAAGVRPRRKA